MLSARATSWLPVRPGEGRLVTLTAAMMLVAGAGIAIGVSGTESLLLSKVGADVLPRLYVVLGLVTIVSTLAITMLLGRISPLRFYLVLPIAVAGLLVGARFLVILDQSWVYQALWITGSLLHTLLQMMLWGVTGMIWDTRQAKRLYPLFATADIAGFSAGGLITPLLVDWLGTANLLLGWAATLLVAYGLARALAPAAPKGGTTVKSRTRRIKHSAWEDLQAGFHYVRDSRLLIWLAVAGLLFQALVYLLWFVFSGAVEIQFPREDELTGFLGVFRGATTGVALLLSLLLAAKINARFGLVVPFVILAVFNVIGFSVLVVAGSFLTIVGLRFIHEVWQSGVARIAWQAMFNVIHPVRREQTRLFINGVCFQVGAMLIGTVLLFAKDAQATVTATYFVGIAVAMLALFASWRVRQAYLSALVEALRLGRPLVFRDEEDPFAAFQRDPAEVTIAIAGLSDPDVEVRRAASVILVDLAHAEIVLALVEGLNDPDPQVRANLLQALGQSNTNTNVSGAQDEVIARLNDPDSEVQVQAIVALRRLASDPKILVHHLHPLLENPDPAVRAESAAGLLKLGPQPEALATLQQMAQADDVDARVAAIKAFADWGDRSAVEPVEVALDDPQPAVRRAAAATLAQIGGPQCLSALVGALGDDNLSVREAVASSIEVFGIDALQATVRALADPELETGAILALTYLPVASQADIIRDYARERIEQALCYHYLWQQIHNWAREVDTARLLADSLKHVAERYGINALRLLSTLADREAFEPAIASLGSSDQSQWANAIETLDSVSDRHTVRPLLLLWEPVVDDPRVNDETGPLLKSLRDADPWVRACAALAARGVSAEEITLELATLARDDPDQTVREAAENELTGDKAMQKLVTLSMMECILFLRRVPLFADLVPAELKQVASITYEQLFYDGELLAEQDEQGDELYIIISGEIRVMLKSDEVTVELARRRPGEFVGEMAIISQAPRAARLVAVGEVRTLCIGQKQFEVILRERPETSLAVMRVLCERLQERGRGGQGRVSTTQADSS